MRRFRWINKLAATGAAAVCGLSLGIPAAHAGTGPTIAASCTPLYVGGNCTVTGGGFQPVFQVQVKVLSADMSQVFGQKTLTADQTGRIEGSFGTFASGNPVPVCTTDVFGYYGPVTVTATELIPLGSGIPSPGTVVTQITAEISPCQRIIWRL